VSDVAKIQRIAGLFADGGMSPPPVASTTVLPPAWRSRNQSQNRSAAVARAPQLPQ
jgi:hypothetical protein